MGEQRISSQRRKTGGVGIGHPQTGECHERGAAERQAGQPSPEVPLPYVALHALIPFPCSLRATVHQRA